MSVKTVNVQVDLKQLDEQIVKKREQDLLDPTAKKLKVRTSVFSLGKDPQLATLVVPKPPNLRFIEVLRDGLNNPYVQLNWRIARTDITIGKIVCFDVYRRVVKREKFLTRVGRRGEQLRCFTREGIERIGRQSTRRGRFQPESVAVSQVNPSLLPSSVRNSNLASEESLAVSRFASSLNRSPTTISRGGTLTNPTDHTNPIVNQADFANSINEKRVRKIGTVSYSSFVAKEKNKFVSVIDNEFVDMQFQDKSVRFGDTYEYYVVSVPSTLSNSMRSNSVTVLVEDSTPVKPPTQILAKKLGTNKVRVSFCIDPADEVLRALVFRLSEDDIVFERMASFVNIRDCINFVDTTIRYGQTYTYRIFLENIHGTFSEPGEITYFMSDQGTLPSTRSNNLKIPLLTTIPDQNSDFIKLTIGANDPQVSYYEIQRRNLTIREKGFSVPSRETGYGGTGWTTHRLFTDRNRALLNSEINKDSNLLSRDTSQQELRFVDDTVQLDHIYQYRIVGKDLFGNKSSYQHDFARAVGKKSVRTPVNLRAVTLRESPFRLKLLWDDDNLATRFNFEEAFTVPSTTDPPDVKIIYKVQRRRLGSSHYETFPLTANNYLIDEVAASDAVEFQVQLTEDVFSTLPNRESSRETEFLNAAQGRIESPVSLTSLSSDSAAVSVSPVQRSTVFSISDIAPVTERRTSTAQQIVRPFGMPEFLGKDNVYFYRVSAIIQEEGEESNFTDEVRINTVPGLSDPIDLQVKVSNTFVRPLVARLSWSSDSLKSRPDHWLVERKFDVATDTFQSIGSAYLSEEFFDRDLQEGNTYIYRIKSFDTIGRESNFVEVRLTV